MGRQLTFLNHGMNHTCKFEALRKGPLEDAINDEKFFLPRPGPFRIQADYNILCQFYDD